MRAGDHVEQCEGGATAQVTNELRRGRERRYLLARPSPPPRGGVAGRGGIIPETVCVRMVGTSVCAGRVWAAGKGE